MPGCCNRAVIAASRRNRRRARSSELVRPDPLQCHRTVELLLVRVEHDSQPAMSVMAPGKIHRRGPQYFGYLTMRIRARAFAIATRRPPLVHAGVEGQIHGLEGLHPATDFRDQLRAAGAECLDRRGRAPVPHLFPAIDENVDPHLGFHGCRRLAQPAIVTRAVDRRASCGASAAPNASGTSPPAR